jgi:acetolactate synthase-1/2/3 large subunit
VTGAQAVIGALAERGVQLVFGIPGTHNLPLYEQLTPHGIRHVTPRHEQGAGYAADGYARATGRPGVCLVTTGPGLTNVLTAAVTAYADSVPLLVISPGMAAHAEGRDTGFLHEVKDQSGATDRLLAWSHRATSPAAAHLAVHRAFDEFATTRPRPVHLEIPLDVMADLGSLADRAVLPPAPPPAREAIERAAELLARAERPVILLGGGAVDAQAEATALAERLGAPVITTVNGKGVVAENHPLSLGASLRLATTKTFITGRDVVLAVGTELGESDLWGPPLRFGGAVIRADIDPRQLAKNAPCTVGVTGDARTVLGALLEKLPHAAPSRGVAETAAELRSALHEEALVDGLPWEELMTLLRGRLSEGAIVTADSTMPAYYGAVHFYDVEGPRRFLYPTGYATLGYALSAAIGARLGHPHRDVLAIIGDGGLMFCVGELMTAVELGLGIAVLVSVNGGYGEIRRQQEEMGMMPIGVDLQNPDFAALAKAVGCAHARPTTAAEAADEVAAATHRPGPTLIEWHGESDHARAGP